MSYTARMWLHFKDKLKMTRACAVILPALLLCAIWMDSWYSVLLAVAFAWLACYTFLLKFCLRHCWLYTLVMTFIITFFYSAYDSLLSLSGQSYSLVFYLDQIFVRSGLFTMMSFGLALPAWLLFWGIDHYLCRFLNIQCQKTSKS